MATPELSDPAEFLFGSYRRRVLGLLLLHPGAQFHLREVARATHAQPGTVRRELSLLTQAGVLERELQGNQVRVRANATYPIHEELRSILKKTSGVADQLRTALMSLENLARIGKLKQHSATREDAAKLLAAACV